MKKENIPEAVQLKSYQVKDVTVQKDLLRLNLEFENNLFEYFYHQFNE